MKIQPFSATSTTLPIGVWGKRTATGVFDKWRETNSKETQQFKTRLHKGVQYTQSDPIGKHGDPNPYAYAMNAPLSSFDIFGLRCEGCCDNSSVRARELARILREVNNAILRHQVKVRRDYYEDMRCATWTAKLSGAIHRANPRCHQWGYVDTAGQSPLGDYPLHTAIILKSCKEDGWEKGTILDAYPFGDLQMASWEEWYRQFPYMGPADVTDVTPKDQAPPDTCSTWGN